MHETASLMTCRCDSVRVRCDDWWWWVHPRRLTEGLSAR